MKKNCLSLPRMAVTGALLSLFAMSSVSLSSCSSTDDTPVDNPSEGGESGGESGSVLNGKGSYFIAVKTDNGTVYVFSNAFNAATTRNAGALRINKGADEYDKDYYFDLQTPAGGYKFRRVWYMTGSKFLLEIYNEKNINTMTAGHQFALVDMAAKKFAWVSGIPAKNQITSGAETGGVPMFADGVIYLPITQFGQDACIYIVDPETAEAKKGITLKGVTEIRTLGKLN